MGSGGSWIASGLRRVGVGGGCEAPLAPAVGLASGAARLLTTKGLAPFRGCFRSVRQTCLPERSQWRESMAPHPAGHGSLISAALIFFGSVLASFGSGSGDSLGGSGDSLGSGDVSGASGDVSGASGTSGASFKHSS